MTRVRWVIFALACATSWLLYLHRYAWGAVKPYLKEENPSLTDSQLGDLDAIFSITYGIGQVPGGMLGDRFGPRMMLTGMILSWSACVAGIAIASGFWMLAVARSLFGLTQAGAYPNLSKVTRSWFPVSVRTSVQGFVASLSGRAGGACASILVVTLLIGTVGMTWRESLLTISLLGLALGISFWFFFRNTPREHPLTSPAEVALIEEGTGPTSPTVKPKLRFNGRRGLTFGALLFYAFCSTFGDQLFVFWLPQFLKVEKGLGPVELGIFASLPLWGGALGGAVGGAMNDFLIRWTGNRRWSRSAVAFTGKFAAGLILAASVLIADGRLVMVALFVCKFFGDWSLSTQWGTITDIAGPSSGTIFGIVNTCGTVGGFIGALLMGRIVQHAGYDALFYTVGGVFVLSSLCWFVIDCTQRLHDDV
jgi:MFS transporter, ACS family, glucarate transporter